MSVYWLQNCKIYLAEFDISGDMNEGHLMTRVSPLDTTTFGNSYRSRLAGLLEFDAAYRGFWQGGDGAIDDNLFDNLGSSNRNLTICPETGAAGEVSYISRAVGVDYSFGGNVGEMLAFDMSLNGQKQPLVRSTVMETGVKTTTFNGTARQLGQVSATQKLYALLHVIAASAGDTLDVKVQSDDNSDFTSPTDRVTFSQATAVGSEWATPVDGPITDDWWRIVAPIGGVDPSFTMIASIGIQ